MTLPSLQIPPRDLSRRPKPYWRVKSLREWIHNLPGADTRATLQAFDSLLQELNRGDYPVHERAQLLDTLRPVARPLVVTLTRHLKQAKIPLSDKNLLTYQHIQNMLEQMASGYKIIVQQLADAPKLKEHDALLLREAIYHSLQYLGRRQLTAYIIYATEPEGVWHELHQLYQYAEAHNLQQEPVDDPAPDYGLPVSYSIDLVYKRCLLLSLAEPYHLMQNEADDIHYLVSAWTPVCKLQPLDHHDPRGEFVLDYAADQAPRFLTEELHWQPRDARIIDMNQVKQRLETHLQQFLKSGLAFLDEDTSTLKHRRQRDMLLRLADAWHGALKRRSPRATSGTRIRMAMGLNAAHHHINHGRDFTPAMDELVIKFRDQDNLSQDVMVTAYDTAMEKDRYHRNKNYDVNPWWQHNHSAAGSALACTAESGCTDVKVGELIAYCQKESGVCTHWQVGAVRWLKTRPGSGIDLGIMNIADSAVPVASKALRGAGEGTEYFRSLLIPRQVSLHQTRSIIVPAMVYDIETVLSINTKRRLFYIRLNRLLLSTQSFSQFGFEVLEQPPVDLGNKGTTG